MTSFIFLVYLADIVENVRGVGILVCVLTVICICACCFLILENDCIPDELTRVVSRINKYLIISFLCALSIVIFTPSKQGVYLMSGFKAGNELIQSETGQKALKVINMKLDEYLNDIQQHEQQKGAH